MSKELEDKIIAELHKMDRLSFVELWSRIPETKGDHLMIRERDNVAVGFGLSQEAIDALSSLLRQGRIYGDPVEVMIYMIDGCMPNMPIAKRAPAGGYKEPHWIPMVICLGQPKPDKTAVKKAPVKKAKKG